MDPTGRKTLDQELLAAHSTNDFKALVALYTRAGDTCEKTGNIDAACFYLTHAYVFALQEGMSEAQMLYQRLVAHDREE